MNILVLHRIPYEKIDYHRGIDHQSHRVLYVGTRASLGNIPLDLACEKIVREPEQNIEDAVIHFVRRTGQCFDRIISLSEYELLAAATLRERLGVTGPSVAQINKVRNKMIMKACVAQRGIAVPENYSLSEVLCTEEKHPTGLDNSVVLKPVDGASSENVFIFDSLDALKGLINGGSTGVAALDRGHYEGFEVESFVRGDILHFDGVVNDDDLICLTASRYVGTCVEYACGYPLASIQFAVDEHIRSFVRECLRAVELHNGAFHIEAFDTANGLVFLELANRVGGADVVKTVELATGIHMPSEELKIYLDKNSYHKPKVEPQTKYYGWFVFPGHTLGCQFGTVQGFSRFQHHENILEWKCLPEGIPLTPTITYQAKEVPLAGILCGAARSMHHCIDELFREVSVKPASLGVATPEVIYA